MIMHVGLCTRSLYFKNRKEIMSSFGEMATQTRFCIVIGTRRYSSWSLRGWLALQLAMGSLSVEEIFIPIAGQGASPEAREAVRQTILKHSPTGKVPVLVDKSLGIVVCESLAIALHLAEHCPAARLLPQDPAARAQCLSASAEMHSSFNALRTHWPMVHPAESLSHGEKTLPLVLADVERLDELFNSLREKYGENQALSEDETGPFLFGRVSIADVMFAPVAIRFKTYDPSLSSLRNERSRQYVTTLYQMEGVRAWIAAASLEDESLRVPAYEAFL